MSKTTALSLLQRNLRYYTKYNKWAYNVLNEYSIAQFGNNDDHYTKITAAPFFTIKSTLYHLLICEQLWWQRLNNVPMAEQLININGTEIGIGDLMPVYMGGPEVKGKHDILIENISKQSLPMNDLYNILNADSQKFIDYVANNEDEKFGEILAYPSAGGKMVEQPIHFVIMQHVNHNTHHRGQISSAFNELLRNRDPIPDNVHLDMHVWERGFYFAEPNK